MVGVEFDHWHLPLTELVPTPVPAQDLQTISDPVRAARYSYLVLTSAYAVECLAAQLADTALAQPLKVAVVGKQTAEALRQLMQRSPDIVPQQQNGRALAKDLRQRVKTGERVLIAGARELAPGFIETSQELGMQVERLELYSSAARLLSSEQLARLRALSQQAQRVYWLCFSPSAVRALADVLALLGAECCWTQEFLAIGPSTHSELARLGFRERYVAPEASEQALYQLLAQRLNS